MEEEIYRDIMWLVGKYQVSNFGNVRGLDRTRKTMVGVRGDYRKRIEGVAKVKGKAIKCFMDDRYRPRVSLDKKKYFVSNLVALHFMEKPMGDNIVVNHIDNNPSNNKASNLEWCTQRQNIGYSIKQGRHSSVTRWSK